MDITFSYKGNDYKLEFDRDVITQMAHRDLTNDFIMNNPEVALPDLFYYAFLKHQRYVNRKDVDVMFKKIKDRENFFVTLYELYRAPIESLMEEPDEDDEGNISWEIHR